MKWTITELYESSIPGSSPGPATKLLLALALAVCAFGQTAPIPSPSVTPSNEFVAVFASYQAYAHPSTTGGIAYAYQLSPNGSAVAQKSYMAVEYNVWPTSLRPFQLQSVARGGVCQQVLEWPVHLFTCGELAMSTAGAGNAVTGGLAGTLLADYRIGKTKWGIAAEIVGMKSALSDPGIAYEIGLRRSRR